MPLRSPKMYSFIFGFQRFVWWPKCTPASSRSFIAIAANRPPRNRSGDGRTRRCRLLPFTELEAFARSRHAVLLAFLGARVARQHAFRLQPLAQLDVVDHQRAGNPESHGARLPGHAAAGPGGQDSE